MTLALVLLAFGIFLSAFFSGAETSFYRASRVRVVIAGLDGDRVSQYLLKLINNPTLFVATTLIGNNVANYLTSLAIVLITQNVTHSSAAEMLAPIMMSPLLFVYGELLPKNLCYQAPNLMLRLAAPMFLLFTCIFAPVAAVLWGMGKMLKHLLGESPEKIRLILARKEVQQVLEDGLEAGILHPTQRHLSQSFFLVASKRVDEFSTPRSEVKSISIGSTRAEALKFARSKRYSDIVLFDGPRNNYVGYVRTVELLLSQTDESPRDLIRSFVDVRPSELFGETIMQMQAEQETVRRVVGSAGQTVGLLFIDQLTAPLLNGPLGSLQR